MGQQVGLLDQHVQLLASVVQLGLELRETGVQVLHSLRTAGTTHALATCLAGNNALSTTQAATTSLSVDLLANGISFSNVLILPSNCLQARTHHTFHHLKSTLSPHSQSTSPSPHTTLPLPPHTAHPLPPHTAHPLPPHT